MKKLLCLRKKILKITFMGFIILFTVCALVGVSTNLKDAYASELKPTDLERIQPGKIAPDFNLQDVDGNWVKLSSYRNKMNVILVFYRGWW